MILASSKTSASNDLAGQVRRALMTHSPLRVWAHGIQVDAQKDTVTLGGFVRNAATKENAGRLARAVKSVSQVNNNLVIDGDVEIAVAGALAADERTRGAFPGIQVGVVFGVAFLKGAVASEEVKMAAGEIAGKVQGVRRVSNELTAPAKSAPAAKV